MGELKIFESAEFGKVRAVDVGGVPYFVGKDVANILGYERPVKAILDHVDEDDKDEVPIQDSIGRMQNTPVINESGLYSLILSSKLPNAKKFKHWVTSDVLPSIRKNGAYMTDDTLEKALTNPDFLIKLATTLKEEKEKNKQLTTAINVQQQLIGELKPKADYTDRILQNKSLVTITQIAKDYGMSGRGFNELLHKLCIQFKQGSQWLLYSKYQALGYTHSNTINITHSDGSRGVVMETRWTQKGRLFLYDMLKKQNILPIIER